MDKISYLLYLINIACEISESIFIRILLNIKYPNFESEREEEGNDFTLHKIYCYKKICEFCLKESSEKNDHQ